jgi:PP-loop superfamily ATP-utilizing enzyme
MPASGFTTHMPCDAMNARTRAMSREIIVGAQHCGNHEMYAFSFTSRSACGVCGLSKRYVFNRVAVEHGYDVVLTGHNLDDEADFVGQGPAADGGWV